MYAPCRKQPLPYNSSPVMRIPGRLTQDRPSDYCLVGFSGCLQSVPGVMENWKSRDHSQDSRPPGNPASGIKVLMKCAAGGPFAAINRQSLNPRPGPFPTRCLACRAVRAKIECNVRKTEMTTSAARGWIATLLLTGDCRFLESGWPRACSRTV